MKFCFFICKIGIGFVSLELIGFDGWLNGGEIGEVEREIGDFCFVYLVTMIL